MDNLEQIWTKTLEKLKPSLTLVSYETWISSLTPIRCDESQGVLYLLLPEGVPKNILEERYLSMIEEKVKETFGIYLRVVFLSPSELEEEKTHDYDATHSLFSDELTLNPKYIFSTFVVGSNNYFAQAAAQAVADKPFDAYNPLFLYGNAGLGKTHLMHAIAHQIKRNYPELKVLYVSSEMFTNELIKAIRENKTMEFQKKYRMVDVLLIDDIQFIEKKESVQQEIFHTFNVLYEGKKQIILSSDRPPKEIATLEERLRSRFEWGLIADIQPPDFEMRVAILCKKAEVEGLRLTDDFMEVIKLIAERIQSNIRELEGAFIRVVAFATLTGQQVDKELARNVLKDVFSTAKKDITPDYIKGTVCKYFNISISDMESSKRSKNLAYPRQIAMYLCRKWTDLSFPKIGSYFGNRDHTTVIHAYDRISDDIKTNQSLRDIIESLESTMQDE